MILAGDVGATKILLEVGEVRGRSWEPALARRYPSDSGTFTDALDEFLNEWRDRHASRPSISAAAFGAAGPVSGNCVKMTNRPWSVDGNTIESRFGIKRARVVNDLEAGARGLELLPARELRTLQPGKGVPGAPRVVLGVGTGLGVAYLVPNGDGYRAIAGEGGHANFAPATPRQADLWRAIFTARGRVSVEDILSGTGLTRIHQFLVAHEGAGTPPPDALSAEAISQRAEQGDACSIAAMELFVECIGSVAGDHAVSIMARGGVFLTGGIVAKILPWLKAERFRAAFCAKGAHSALMQRIPVRAVTSERLAVLGAAVFAAEN